MGAVTTRRRLWLASVLLVQLQICNNPSPFNVFLAFLEKGFNLDRANVTIDHIDHAAGVGVVNETNILEKEIERTTNSTVPHHNHISGWQPTDEWINNCIEQQKIQNSDLHKPYNVTWKKYQLGDCLRTCRKCDSTVKSSRMGNLSIAGQYWDHVCHHQNKSELGMNLTYLIQLFRTYEANPFPYTKPWPRPEEDELVIHLRLGDVMDETKYVGQASIFDMLKSGADTRHGPKSYYPSGIKSIHEYLELIRQSGMQKVVLRGGSHFPKKYPKSKIFSMCLAEAIRTAGYNITNIQVSGENNPDQDFYYMSHAKKFIQATGGFSRVMANLVELLGGQVVEQEK